jgi:hypothetical protein
VRARRAQTAQTSLWFECESRARPPTSRVCRRRANDGGADPTVIRRSGGSIAPCGRNVTELAPGLVRRRATVRKGRREPPWGRLQHSRWGTCPLACGDLRGCPGIRCDAASRTFRGGHDEARRRAVATARAAAAASPLMTAPDARRRARRRVANVPRWPRRSSQTRRRNRARRRVASVPRWPCRSLRMRSRNRARRGGPVAARDAPAPQRPKSSAAKLRPAPDEDAGRRPSPQNRSYAGHFPTAVTIPSSTPFSSKQNLSAAGRVFASAANEKPSFRRTRKPIVPGMAPLWPR